jgi:hypothetical protein
LKLCQATGDPETGTCPRIRAIGNRKRLAHDSNPMKDMADGERPRWGDVEIDQSDLTLPIKSDLTLPIKREMGATFSRLNVGVRFAASADHERPWSTGRF